jgi:hypothetical protein
MLSYEDFAQSAAGRFVRAQALEQVAAMEQLGHQGKPAIAALDAVVAAAFPDLNDTERQHCGRIVRDVLMARGWRTDRQKRVSGWKLFRSGTVYVPHAPTRHEPAPHAPALSPVARARTILAAGRRDPDGVLDTVDAFLADRRAMWGEA